MLRVEGEWGSRVARNLPRVLLLHPKMGKLDDVSLYVDEFCFFLWIGTTGHGNELLGQPWSQSHFPKWSLVISLPSQLKNPGSCWAVPFQTEPHLPELFFKEIQWMAVVHVRCGVHKVGWKRGSIWQPWINPKDLLMYLETENEGLQASLINLIYGT